MDKERAVLNLTSYSDNNLLLPERENVINFYRNILEGYVYDELDFSSEDNVIIEDIGIYANLIIHKSSINTSQHILSSDALKRFIDLGGNIILIANDTSRLLGYTPSSYASGHFLYDYFNINRVQSNVNTRLALGVSTNWNNLPDLEIDLSKIPVAWNNRLRQMEVFSSDRFHTLYTYFSNGEGTSSVFDGLPIAFYTTKGNSQIVVTSIPLYFIKEEQSKLFIQTVLNHLAENTSDFDHNVLSVQNINLHNYPNPFNPSTIIEFSLPVPTNIEIDIFNIRGQKIRSLTNDSFLAGSHKIEWNGTDDSGRAVGSGIYFYRMIANDFSVTRRMVLLK